MKNFTKLFFSLILFILSQDAFGANIVVTNTADVGVGSLREAIDNAVNGDTITFDASTNGTPIVLTTELTLDVQVTIIGNDSTNTILSAGGNGRIFFVSDTMSVANIRFRDGNLPSYNFQMGAAIFVSQTGVLHVDACDFTENTSAIGAAVHCYFGGDAYLSNSRFYNNTGLGGGTEGGGVVSVTVGIGSEVEINNCHFEGNTYTQTDANSRTGAVLYAAGGIVNVTGSSFVNNSATGVSGRTINGGVVYFNGFGSFTIESTFTDCVFDGNTANAVGPNARANGGILYTRASVDVGFYGCTFTNNSCVSDTSTAGGGVFYLNIDSDVDSTVIENCHFENNSCTMEKAIGSANGGAINIQDSDKTIIRNCSFVGNTSTSNFGDGGGGACFFTAGVDTSCIENCTFYGNQCTSSNRSRGGAVEDNALNAFYTNCTFTGNDVIGTDVVGTAGGGLSLTRTFSNRTLRNNIFALNTSTGRFPDLRYQDPGPIAVLSQNIVMDATPSPVVFAYNTDPLFDPAGAQFNGGSTKTVAIIGATSDAIDNADGFAPTFDQRNAIRSGNADIGAYEVGGCVTTSSSIDISACEMYTVPSGNAMYTTSGVYLDTIPNAMGCDSIITLDLTINQPNTGTDTQTACDSYTWIDGNTYSSSNNSATHVVTNSVGCDSTVTLDLTILNSTNGTDTQVACDTYTWIDGNTYNTSNTSATFVLTNAAGCDSTVTLDLTILNSTAGTDTQVACDTYTWIDGNTYNTSNTSATFVLTNAAGCDSIVTLDLTILNSTTGTDTQVACDSYTWIDGNTYNASNNSATFTLTNTAGCDSIVTLDLTILNSTTGTDTQVACDTYTWIDGNTYTASNNSATFVLTNAAGCDSIVTLDLTINTVDVTVIEASPTLTVNEAGATYQWIDCDNGNSVIQGETNQSFTAAANGNYAVIVDNGNCMDTSACVLITGVGIEQVSTEEFSVYPNPNNGAFMLQFETAQPREIEIWTTDGMQVSRYVSNENQLSISLELESGVYIVRIQQNGLIYTQRFVIQN